ncbi:hypothetical protein FOZ63_008291 [Perkinsus olseni]|uniref:Uncharacterized protein n=1 Tax=Perkinsus olseni TaxID=32597 RepID=A0A7J6NH74_PEROL|nr:hypothetical protein FOZ60_009466 [Perkinsus olseni]KAF4738649.1 hypothetical protein FOZ63_008291 [Perkinsus olseni]
MFITLGYLLSILLLPTVVAQRPKSSNSRFLNETVVPQAESNGDATFWAEMAGLVRLELSYVSSDNGSMPLGLATAVVDDKHPFWEWMAAEMQETFDALAVNDTDTLPPLGSTLENYETIIGSFLAAHSLNNSSSYRDRPPPGTKTEDDHKNPFVAWLEHITFILTNWF